MPLTLESSDYQFISVQRDITEQSSVIKNLMEDIDIDEITIPFDNISAKILQLVVDWCTHRWNLMNTNVVDTSDTSDTSDTNATNASNASNTYVKDINGEKLFLDDWEKEFFDKLDLNILFEFIRATNYLDIKPLVVLSCKVVATRIKDKPHDEIMQIFNIEPTEEITIDDIANDGVDIANDADGAANDGIANDGVADGADIVVADA